jgi:hypothetical protein
MYAADLRGISGPDFHKNLRGISGPNPSLPAYRSKSPKLHLKARPSLRDYCPENRKGRA